MYTQMDIDDGISYDHLLLLFIVLFAFSRIRTLITFHSWLLRTQFIPIQIIHEFQVMLHESWMNEGEVSGLRKRAADNAILRSLGIKWEGHGRIGLLHHHGHLVG